MNKVCCFLILTTLLFQCKSNDYLTPYEFDGRIIDFGSGGGFSGKVLMYTLLENGQIFHGTNEEGNVTAVKKLDKQKVKQIFDNYDNLHFADMKMNDPGNQYKFITIKNGGMKNKLTWGGTMDDTPKELKVFYSILMSHVNQRVNNSSKKFQIK